MVGRRLCAKGLRTYAVRSAIRNLGIWSVRSWFRNGIAWNDGKFVSRWQSLLGTSEGRPRKRSNVCEEGGHPTRTTYGEGIIAPFIFLRFLALGATNRLRESWKADPDTTSAWATRRHLAKYYRKLHSVEESRQSETLGARKCLPYGSTARRGCRRPAPDPR